LIFFLLFLALGYGDIYPITLYGKIFAGICAVLGVLILAMPIGITSANFTKVIEKRKHRKHLLKSMNTKM